MNDSKKIYFFGVSSAQNKGHFLHHEGMRVAWDDKKLLPFSSHILDGGLLPQHPQVQGELHLAVINGWTLLSMWDRTADSRPGSNAVFLAEGNHVIEEMKNIASEKFPAIWKRIQGEQHPPPTTEAD